MRGRLGERLPFPHSEDARLLPVPLSGRVRPQTGLCVPDPFCSLSAAAAAATGRASDTSTYSRFDMNRAPPAASRCTSWAKPTDA